MMSQCSLHTPLILPRLSSRWLVELCRAKLIPAAERLSKERDEYMEAALSALRTEMAAQVPAICQQVSWLC
jgi:serine/threonine-protein kinase ULK4